MISEHDLLVRELGKLGGIGARFTARFLSINVGEVTRTFPVPVPVVERACQRLIAGSQLVDEPPVPGSIRAIVGAGSLNLNPTVLTISITAESPLGTRVHIRGAAKEGLVKQRAGEQVAVRFSKALEETLSLTRPHDSRCGAPDGRHRMVSKDCWSTTSRLSGAPAR
jgi:hypothetical protein